MRSVHRAAGSDSLYRASPASYDVRRTYYPRPRKPRRIHVGRLVALVVMTMVVGLQVVSAAPVVGPTAEMLPDTVTAAPRR